MPVAKGQHMSHSNMVGRISLWQFQRIQLGWFPLVFSSKHWENTSIMQQSDQIFDIRHRIFS